MRDTAAVADAKTYPEIGERLVALRRAFSDDNIREWSERHGFNRTQYTHWETGTRRIPVEHAEKLVQLYGLSLDWIYMGRSDSLSTNALKRLSGSRPTS